VLDGLGWERAYVVGHSWGGHLLVHLALERPERLLGGLAVDPLGAVGDGGAGAMQSRFEQWLAGRDETPAGEHDDESHDEMLESLRRVWPAYFASPDEAPPMPEISASAAAYRGIWETIQVALPTLEERLGQIEVEIGFVAGQLSPLAPEESSLPTAAAIPDAWVEVVPAAGHFPWVEQPGCVRSALDRLAGG
jgi:pimeloyl-ACP methyl ester carboxylesterase